MLSVLIAACVSLFGATGVPAKTIRLTMASQNPATSPSHINTIMPWVDQVEKATNGQVKIQVFAGQTLTKGKDTWEALKNGIADIGWCFHGYWPGLTPLADGISLPALPFTTAEKGSETFWKLYEKFPSLQKEFSDNKVLLLFTSDPYILITRNKQVKTIEDIKGMKIRSAGGPPTDQLKALNGVPMMIPMPDNYISLQKGVIDGMGAPWEAIETFRLYEVVEYYTDTPFSAVYFSISMNKNKWNSLPKDVQEGITSVSGLKGSVFWGKTWFDDAKEAVYKKAKSAGYPINTYNLPKEERARWIAQSGKPLWQEWVKKMESEGRTDAQAILDAILAMNQ
jgi:TRAP-type C4-dicarboxylate transport system substrate-binding protein